MAKKDEKTVQQVQEMPPTEPTNTPEPPSAAANPSSQTPNYDLWRKNMRAKYGEDKSDEELYALSTKGYNEEHEYAKQARADLDQFSKTIQNNPTMLAFYQKLIELGEDNAEMALLELGDDLVSYLNGEIDSDVYKERKRLKADADAENARKSEELGQKKIAQRAALEAWAEKKGIDPDEFIDKVQTTLLEPMAAFSAEEALFDALYNMLNYDAAVASAEVRGRNANIQEQRRSVPKTTTPQGGAGVSTSTATGGVDLFSEIANSEKRQRDKNRAQ